jgi:hypothetical protein
MPPDDAFLQRNDFLDALLGLISLSERLVSLSAELATDAPMPAPVSPAPAPIFGPILR